MYQLWRDNIGLDAQHVILVTVTMETTQQQQILWKLENSRFGNICALFTLHVSLATQWWYLSWGRAPSLYQCRRHWWTHWYIGWCCRVIFVSVGFLWKPSVWGNAYFFFLWDLAQFWQWQGQLKVQYLHQNKFPGNKSNADQFRIVYGLFWDAIYTDSKN